MALTEPDSLDYACDVFIGDIRRELLRLYGRERDAIISLARGRHTVEPGRAGGRAGPTRKTVF